MNDNMELYMFPDIFTHHARYLWRLFEDKHES